MLGTVGGVYLTHSRWLKEKTNKDIEEDFALEDTVISKNTNNRNWKYYIISLWNLKKFWSHPNWEWKDSYRILEGRRRNGGLEKRRGWWKIIKFQLVGSNKSSWSTELHSDNH